MSTGTSKMNIGDSPSFREPSHQKLPNQPRGRRHVGNRFVLQTRVISTNTPVCDKHNVRNACCPRDPYKT
ncbi:hypothetical protein SCLCIDRAFT_1221695 [Scleroderma citrinum Foug A]|uniref:Uncharacterized protein n=1 Tax=Scleroderma citrinum Foug A TaxID=1036808 RepID=A0A0C2YYU2_9AGAM|nr:hypothetical protein SCLCIDRAFT_1221695 [Scleroderma citrinum Foug A]